MLLTFSVEDMTRNQIKNGGKASVICRIRELVRELKEGGMSDEAILKAIFSDKEYPSSVKMCYDRIILLVAENIQVRLSPMEMTLYELLLRHPDGISSDDLVLHWKELCSIYRFWSMRDDPAEVESIMESLCDESKVVLYSTVSRIKKRMKAAVGPFRAGEYCIKMDSGLYRIKAKLVE